MRVPSSTWDERSRTILAMALNYKDIVIVEAVV